MPLMSAPASPCINVCRMSEADGVCMGCYRTLEEIARWGGMSDAERAAVLARLAPRRAAIGEFDLDVPH